MVERKNRPYESNGLLFNYSNDKLLSRYRSHQSEMLEPKEKNSTLSNSSFRSISVTLAWLRNTKQHSIYEISQPTQLTGEVFEHCPKAWKKNFSIVPISMSATITSASRFQGLSKALYGLLKFWTHILQLTETILYNWNTSCLSAINMAGWSFWNLTLIKHNTLRDLQWALRKAHSTI